MGEMQKAIDSAGNLIEIEYDILGRRTSLESADSGRQEFFYDECSNLIREDNSVLREKNQQILYEYDGLNRLIKIDYPETEDTIYTFGSKEDKEIGAVGKILCVKDASGTLSYNYGKLGEVTKEERTLNVHVGNESKHTSVMQYRSDYLGRMQYIIYPDGEKIVYGYDDGGQVVSVTGENFGEKFSYVKNILYDEYGQRTRIEYGNGTFTEYVYDEARRWLSSIKTENGFGQIFQNMTYEFDAVGNVLGYDNNCFDGRNGNYKTAQKYGYDDLYQLISVNGETTYNPYRSSVPDFKSTYSQNFKFDSLGLGNMTSKVSKETVTPMKTIGDDLNYSLDYVYDENYAHRLVRAGERYYKYDSNGNLISEQDGKEDVEESRYGRTVEKLTEEVYATDYGWGLYSDDNSSSKPKEKFKRTYTWNEKNMLISSVDSRNRVAYIYGQDNIRSNKYTSSSETLYFNKMWTLHTDSGNAATGGQTAKNIYLGDTRIVTKLNSPDSRATYSEEYHKQYYYHSDHLGSASLISDYEGYEYQRLEYTPYGEIWVEKTQNTGSAYLPYKFTGKEMDEETGLYYYGARYLDPKYSRWLSTDPALSEYVSKDYKGTSGGIYNSVNLNLYHYAGNSPVRYIDPTGMEEDVTEAEKQLQKLKELGEEIFHKGTINGVNLYTNNSEDGCFARATVIAGELENLGFEVTDYSYAGVPVKPGVIRSEKNAGRDPSKVPDKDSNGNPNRFSFHVATTVIIDGKKYVVDPFYSKSWLAISEQEDWYSCQYPKSTSTQTAYDAKGNLIAPRAMNYWKTQSGYTGNMTISEYARGWLKNYDAVKKKNIKNGTKDDPYIWSGK